MQDEILNAIEASNRAFAEFKANNDERWADLDRREAKANRPRLGGFDPDSSPADVQHSKGFATWMRKGLDTGLAELERKSAFANSTSGGADGGYAVPVVIDSKIQELMLPQNPIRANAEVIQVGTSDFHRLMNLRGLAAGWVGETDPRPPTDTPKFADLKPVIGEIYANPQATQQMLDDAFFSVENWLARQLADTFSLYESRAFLTGNGINQPTGILTAPTSNAADATRAFGTVQVLPTGNAGTLGTEPLDVLQAAIYSMRPGYRVGAKWYMSSSTRQALGLLKDTLGRYLLLPSPVPGAPAQILGFDVVECEDMPALGANAVPIFFANLSRSYLIVDRMGIRILRDPYTNKPYVGFYTTKRVGGILTDTAAIKFIKVSAA